MYIFTLVAGKKKNEMQEKLNQWKRKEKKDWGGEKKGREREGKRKSQGQYKITEMGPNTWVNRDRISSCQFSRSVVPTLCDPMNRSTPGLPVHHQLPVFTQTHVHQVSDAIQPSHPLLSPSPPAPNPSQHQSLFQWVSSSHEVAKVLEFQLQHQFFQWTPRTDLL